MPPSGAVRPPLPAAPAAAAHLTAVCACRAEPPCRRAGGGSRLLHRPCQRPPWLVCHLTCCKWAGRDRWLLCMHS